MLGVEGFADGKEASPAVARNLIKKKGKIGGAHHPVAH